MFSKSVSLFVTVILTKSDDHDNDAPHVIHYTFHSNQRMYHESKCEMRRGKLTVDTILLFISKIIGDKLHTTLFVGIELFTTSYEPICPQKKMKQIMTDV